MLTNETTILHAFTMNHQDKTVLIAQVQKRYDIMSPYLSEHTKRIWVAAEALAIGRGGNAIVSEATGISRTTLTKAKQDVLSQPGVSIRQRHQGGGRKKLLETDATLVEAIDAFIDPSTRGDPESPLRWTSKSTYH